MVKNISRNLHLISNLAADAKWHKMNCVDPHCGVSLFMLREAAAFIFIAGISEEDKAEAEKLIEEMPTI